MKKQKINSDIKIEDNEIDKKKFEAKREKSIEQKQELKIYDEFAFCDDIATIAAKKYFGIDYLYPWQRLVIANILEQDCEFNSRQIVLLPTGAGKSLCFQIPALLLDGATLIIYPLIALMNDQERRMNQGSLKCVVFNGGQTDEERNENFRKLSEENYKVIIANPEVLENQSLLENLSSIKIDHIAIDEAHCTSEWGDSFRKSYLSLGNVIKKINPKVVTAFTATASSEVLKRVSEVLFDGIAHIVRSESDRPNIHYYVKHVASKIQAALFLCFTEQKPMIIFANSRRNAENMSRYINMVFGNNYSKFYHAGLEKSEKTAIEKWFFEQKNAVLCATCAFGMGIDKSDIRTVIHLNPCKTAESYIQEAGRAGRDRNTANAILLWDKEDEIEFQKASEKSRAFFIKELANTKVCRRDVLLKALGSEEDAVCSGCDLCDERKNKEIKQNWKNKIKNERKIKNKIKKIIEKPHYLYIPGSLVPVDYQILLDLIKTHDKYFTKESLKEEFLLKINGISQFYTKLNLWNDKSFNLAFDYLIWQNKIKVMGFPWKNRITWKIKRKD